VGVRIHFHRSGYTPLTQVIAVLQQSRVTIKEMSVEAGENDSDTIHLFLKLPRGLTPEKLTTLIADLAEVRTVSLD
jgi:hypothetical protein